MSQGGQFLLSLDSVECASEQFGRSRDAEGSMNPRLGGQGGSTCAGNSRSSSAAGAVNCAVIVTAHDASGDTGQNGDPGILTGNREFWPVSSELDGIRFGLVNRRLQPLGHLTADCKYT